MAKPRSIISHLATRDGMSPLGLLTEFALKAIQGDKDAWRQIFANDPFLQLTRERAEGFARALDPHVSFSTQAYDAMKPLLKTPGDAWLRFLPDPWPEIFSKGVRPDSFYRELLKQEPVLDLLDVWADNLPGQGTLYDESRYNHRFLTENARGEIVPVDDDEIIALFQPARANGWQKPERFDRMILTASHARGENEDDIRHITHGIEAMARDSWPDAEPGTYKKPRILFACDTEKNPFLNGIRLQRRLNEIKRSLETGEPDRFHEISEGATRMAKLMLACMCENYYGEDANGELTRLFNIDDPRPLSEIFAQTGDRIRLSPDATRIAQHFQLVGYSKGGNVVSDAMRYLESSMRSVNGQGRDLIQIPVEEEYYRGIRQVGEGNIRNILRNIDVASIAAKEFPLTDAQKRNGLQRVAFNNKYDDLTKHDDYPSSWHDEKYMIHGVRENQGHDPEDAMGTRTKRGYVMNDHRVARRMREFFAPHYGKAAVAHLHFRTQDPYTSGLILETAAGTPDDSLRAYQPIITEALSRAGLHGVEIEGGHPASGQFRITAEENLLNDIAALEKLRYGFRRLLDDAPGLVIAQSIVDDSIPSRISHLQGRGKG